MKNLKRVLSLVLATVMVIGMMVVGASAADYKDADKIDYTEAVDVMSAVGMIEGYAGNFGPEGKIDRAGATKLITYLMLGTDVASKLTVSEAPFEDVPANAWYAPFVAFCAEKGLLEGYNGKFYPNEPINAYGFAKLLLGALGYRADIENLTGDTWQVNVATLAIQNGLFDGNDGAFANQDMTRQEACLYAFNALKAVTVSYTGGTNVTMPGGATVTVGAIRGEDTNANDYRVGSADTMQQLCEKLYPTLKLQPVTSDEFGRTAHEWKFGKPAKSVGVYADAAELVYEGAVKGSTIFADLGKPSSYEVTVCEDGKDDAHTTANSTLFTAKNAAVGGNGSVVEVFTSVNAADKTIVTVVVTNTYFAKVASVTAAKGDNAAYVTVAAKKFETEAFAKGDAVIYTMADNVIQTMALAETMNGKIDRIKNNDTYTIAGSDYELSETAKLTLTAGSTYDFYLDNQGNIIGADAVKEAAAQYGVLLDIRKVNDGWGNTADSYEGKLLLADGEIVTVPVKGVTAVSGSKTGDVVSYTVKDSVYTLTVRNDAVHGTANVDVVAGKSEISYGSSKLYTNNKTLFVVRGGEANDWTYTVYQGFKAVPNVEKVTFKAAVGTDDIATMVYITTSTETGSTGTSLMYVAAKSEESYTDDGKTTYYTYNVVKNGEPSTITTDKQVTTSGLYKNVVIDKDGIVTGMTAAVEAPIDNFDCTATQGTGAENDGVVTLGGVAYGYTSDVLVFSVDGDGVIRPITVEDIQDDGNDDVLFTMNKSGIVTAIYVVPADGGEPVVVDKIADGKVLPGAVAVGSGKDYADIYTGENSTYPNDKHIVFGYTKPVGTANISLTISAVDGTLMYEEAWNNYTANGEQGGWVVNISNNLVSSNATWHYTGALPAGTYYYEITVGTNVTSGMFTI